MKNKTKQNVITNQASVDSVKNKITVLVILCLVLEKNPARKLPRRKKISQGKNPPRKIPLILIFLFSFYF